MMIREWTSEDLQTVRDITWETWVATYASFIPMEDLRGYLDEHYTIEALGKLMKLPTFRGFLAMDEGSVAGYAKVKYNDDDQRCYLSSLYVLPAFQGRGIGGKLLSVGEGFAKTFGVNEIWLGVMVQNTSALDWYSRSGFRFIREEPFTMGNTTVQHRIGFRPIQPTASLQ